MVTSPVSFFKYTFKYNLLWYGNVFGLILTACYFVLPFALLVVSLYKKIIKRWTVDCWSAGPGRVFFIEPDGFIPSLLWATTLAISQHCGLFIMCGNDDDAINHSWYDTKTHKDFWRDCMEAADVRVPREMGRWINNDIETKHKLEGEDLVIKLTDSYLGVGDIFLNHGEHYNTKADLRKIMRETKYKAADGETDYSDKEALLLEFVRPTPSLGVHSLDILTISTPKGPKVITCLLWADCTTDSSHSTQAGYILDVETETVTNVVKWYSAYFANMEPKLLGTKIPGVREACAKAVAAHAECTKRLPFLKMIGWDAMVLKNNNDVVFFEGNFASARIPRRIFLGAECLFKFLTNRIY